MAQNTICREIWLGWSAPLADQCLRSALADFPGLTRIHTDEDKRFAFLEFDSFESAARLLEHSRLTVGDVEIKVRPKKPLECLFLRNIPWSMTPQAAFDFCSTYGEVSYIYVSHSDDGRSNGYAFLAYTHIAELDAALVGLNGAECGGRILTAERADRSRQPNSRRGAFKFGIYSEFAPQLGCGDRLVYSTPELPPEPRMPLRYKEAPEIPYTRRKGSRRRKDRQ